MFLSKVESVVGMGGASGGDLEQIHESSSRSLVGIAPLETEAGQLQES